MNAFGSLLSDIARKPFDRAMQKLSYSKYASDTYHSIRIVCTVCQNLPNTRITTLKKSAQTFFPESFVLPCTEYSSGAIVKYHQGLTTGGDKNRHRHSQIERCVSVSMWSTVVIIQKNETWDTNLDNDLDVRFATKSQDYLSRLQIQSDVGSTLSEAHAVSAAPRRAVPRRGR